MTLYELNQNAYSRLSKMTSAEIKQAIDKNIKMFNDSDGYLMLLCKELSDYTVFNVITMDNPIDLWEEIIDLLKSRGTLKAIEGKEDGTVEFWVQCKNDDICHMYLLFNYNWGVIDIG